MSDHKSQVQYERARVVCLNCAWFKHDAAADKNQLYEYGRQHAQAARPR